MAFVLLLVDFTLMISVLSLLSWNHKGGNPNIKPLLRNFWRVNFDDELWEHILKCVI
jgi:hypothetical protein